MENVLMQFSFEERRRLHRLADEALVQAEKLGFDDTAELLTTIIQKFDFATTLPTEITNLFALAKQAVEGSVR